MDIKLPRLGEGADSGNVVSIFVKEGDVIKKDQVLLELESEKAVASIPSPSAGTISKIHVKEGDKINVGQLIFSLSEDGVTEKVSASEEKVVEKIEPVKKTGDDFKIVEETEEVSPVPHVSNYPPAAAPSVRKIARDLGIDLTGIKGSERGGRIVLRDLHDYIQKLQHLALRNQQAPQVQTEKPVVESIDFSKWGKVTRKPLTGLRKTISQKMSESWSAVPRVTQFEEVDITGLMELRKKYSGKYEKKGTHLTITPFALKACVVALQKHPIFNSSIDEVTHEIVFKEYYHLGVAVDTEAGLMVPVIRDVDKKNLLELSKELDELAGKARNRKISLEELKGGTFTISNQGGIGGGPFTPIVNTPEIAILGMGRGMLKTVVKNKKIETRLMLPLTLSYDHRAVDGANAVRFLLDIIQVLEQFKESDVKL